MSLTAQSSWRNNIPLASGFHHVSNSLKFFSENMHNCYIQSNKPYTKTLLTLLTAMATTQICSE
jgi:hypothetical protein